MLRPRIQHLIALSLCASGLLLLALKSTASGESKSSTEPAPKPVQIEKFYYLFHPVCWSMGMRGDQPPPKVNAQEYLACYRWEKKMLEKQKELISKMGPHEALVLFPIGASPPMLDLQNHATKTLGRRCIIITYLSVDPPMSWSKIPNVFERFVSDEPLEGREKFLKTVPSEIQRELRDEIRSALALRKSNWNFGMFETIYTSRMYAWELKNELQKRQLTYDPATVENEAFGEGFEQCAMTWKTMLVPYMGFAKPAENNFELSVSGAPYLLGAKFKERVALPHDTRLFLWEAADGRHIGMYAHPWFRLRDRSRNVSIPLDGRSLEVWELMQKAWPPSAAKSTTGAAPLKEQGGRLKVPVFNAIRREPGEAYYVIATDISYDEFRKLLTQALIE